MTRISGTSNLSPSLWELLCGVLFIPILVFSSCTASPPQSDSKESPLPELTYEQETALETFTTLQLNTKGHLYSTFSGIEHPCFPADSSFALSRFDLQMVLEQLIVVYGKDLIKERGVELANTAALAQEEYIVLECFGSTHKMIDDTLRSVRAPGTWVLPEVLGQIDVVIKW